MRSDRLNHATTRTLLSICAASFGVVLCVWLNHFVLRLDDPAGFYRFSGHRCGQVLIAASVWCAVEVVNLATLVSPARVAIGRRAFEN